MSFYESAEEIIPGDVVAVRHGTKGRQEGLVVGSHVDFYGRQIIEVQLDNGYYHYLPHVPGAITRVRRTTSTFRPSPIKQRTVERRIYW